VAKLREGRRGTWASALPAEGVHYRVERFAAKLEERLTTLRGRVTADVTQRGRNSG